MCWPSTTQFVPSSLCPTRSGRNASTTIPFSLNEMQNITIKIFDISGREVMNLFAGQKEIGSHTIRWNGKDNLGNDLPSGMYIYQLKGNNSQVNRKMHLIR